MRFRDLLLLCALALVSCSKLMPDLVGDWKSEPTDSEWGRVQFIVSLKENGKVEIEMMPVEGGKGIVTRGSYQIRGSYLTSDVIGGKEPVKIWFEGDKLIVDTETDPPRRFEKLTTNVTHRAESQ
jgi:hypothetical protein